MGDRVQSMGCIYICTYIYIYIFGTGKSPERSGSSSARLYTGALCPGVRGISSFGDIYMYIYVYMCVCVSRRRKRRIRKRRRRKLRRSIYIYISSRGQQQQHVNTMDSQHGAQENQLFRCELCRNTLISVVELIGFHGIPPPRSKIFVGLWLAHCVCRWVSQSKITDICWSVARSLCASDV